MDFIEIYIVAALLAFYFVTSFIVSVDSISDNLLLTSPSEWQDEVTLGNILIGLFVAALPLVNFAVVFFGLVFSIIDFFRWLCRTDVMQWRPFRRY
jgi:glucan phosphoethanolaminetransferase (alkaline phosphatase superfamily)